MLVWLFIVGVWIDVKMLSCSRMGREIIVRFGV